jgi:hypothetical protein
VSARAQPASAPVLLAGELADGALAALLRRVGLSLEAVAAGAPIPGSYWGAPEAGLAGTRVYARADTPVHSVLHEACHVLCMDGARRACLDTDAGGDIAEENAVLCLQILLADLVPGVGRLRVMADMDAWGYTFRLGCARAYFEQESGAAFDWLRGHGLIDGAGRPTFRARA